MLNPFSSMLVHARLFLATMLVLIGMGVAADAFAATKYASNRGSSSASGNSRSDPWDANSCMTRLRQGDTCVYLPGNYGSTTFAPTTRGIEGSRITHRCETLHACVFDRMDFHDVAYLNVVNIASDTNFYDSSKSSSNPRVAVYSSHHLKFDSISVRGEPERCANGNPGPGCGFGSEYNRYNDLVKIGFSNSEQRTSWAIEISGASRFINANHTLLQLYDDGDTDHCETTESNFWIHGTPETPIVFSNQYHHSLEVQGACNVLVEYVDFGPAGTGRGDLVQPTRSTEVQSGAVIHGSTIRNLLVRYSNFARGGSGTENYKTHSHIEVGMFGEEVNGACFPHNSHFQPWGTFASVGRLNNVSVVDNVSIVNNAITRGWYLQRVNRNAATSSYDGFLISQSGTADNVSVSVDGIIADAQSAGNGVLIGSFGASVDFSSVPASVNGVSIGSSVYRSSDALFRDPSNFDFRPAAGSPVVGAAVPVARATSAGSGSTIPVDRAECFAGTMGGMRDGDQITVAGANCTVVDTDPGNGTVSCDRNLSWNQNAPIYFVVDGETMQDIGSRTVSSPGPIQQRSLPDARAPKPPKLLQLN